MKALRNKQQLLTMPWWAVACLTGGLAVMVMGCEGQNPFKRQHDPIPEYRETIANAKPYIQGQKNTEQVDPNTIQSYCASPFNVLVENDEGANYLKFSENTERVYKINVRSDPNQTDFKIEPTQKPEGAEFKEIQRNKETAVYELRWNPGRLVEGAPNHSVMYLNYKNTYAQKNCGGLIRIGLNLVVSSGQSQMVVTLADLPASTKLEYGKDFNFKLVVEDYSASSKNPPTVKGAVDPRESGKANGALAVDCDKNAVGADNFRWTFNCKFTSSSLASIKDLPLNSGKTVNFGFAVQAQGANGAVQQSNSGTVSIEFKGGN